MGWEAPLSAWRPAHARPPRRLQDSASARGRQSRGLAAHRSQAQQRGHRVGVAADDGCVQRLQLVLVAGIQVSACQCWQTQHSASFRQPLMCTCRTSAQWRQQATLGPSALTSAEKPLLRVESPDSSPARTSASASRAQPREAAMCSRVLRLRTSPSCTGALIPVREGRRGRGQAREACWTRALRAQLQAALRAIQAMRRTPPGTQAAHRRTGPRQRPAAGWLSLPRGRWPPQNAALRGEGAGNGAVFLHRRRPVKPAPMQGCGNTHTSTNIGWWPPPHPSSPCSECGH